MRLKKLTTFSGGAAVYCVINTTDGATSEVALTSKTKGLSDGETFAFDPGVGTIWGQKALHSMTNNLAVTYNCFLRMPHFDVAVDCGHHEKLGNGFPGFASR